MEHEELPRKDNVTMGRMYTANMDIDPDDTKARITLLRAIVGLRVKGGITRVEFSRRLSLAITTQGKFERRSNWPVSTVQRATRVVDRVFTMHPMHFPDPPANAETDILTLVRPRNEVIADQLHVAQVKNFLVRCRYHLGIKATDIAELCGTSFKGVSHWEIDSDNPFLSTIQRYARAVGVAGGTSGYLALNLAEVGAS